MFSSMEINKQKGVEEKCIGLGPQKRKEKMENKSDKDGDRRGMKFRLLHPPCLALIQEIPMSLILVAIC